MISTTSNIESVLWLERKLARSATRFRLVETASFTVTMLGAFILILALYATVDYLFSFPRLVRACLTLTLFAGIWGVLRRLAARRTFRFKDTEQVVRRIETIALERGESQRSILISALQFGKHPDIPGSTPLKNTVIETARNSAMDPDRISTHDRHHVRQACWLGGLGLLVLATWVVFASPSLKIFLRRVVGLSAHYPTATRILAVKWAHTAPSRQDYPLAIHTAGKLPAGGTLKVTYPGRRPFTIPLEATTNGIFAASVKAPDVSFTFAFTLGDFASDNYAVRILVPARIEQGKIEITPPAYTKIPPSTVGLGGVTIPEGSKLRLAIRPDRDLKSCDWLIGSNKINLVRAGDREYAGVAIFTNSFRYQLQLVGADTLLPSERIEYELNVIKDAAPRLKVVSPVANSIICNLSVIRFEARAEDDYDIQSVDIEYEHYRTINNVESRIKTGTLSPSSTGAGKVRDIRLDKVAREWSPEAGDRLRFRFMAKDNRPGQPNTGWSDAINVQIVSTDELRKFVEAEQTRAGALILKLRDDEKQQAEAIERRLKSTKT